MHNGMLAGAGALGALGQQRPRAEAARHMARGPRLGRIAQVSKLVNIYMLEMGSSMMNMPM